MHNLEKRFEDYEFEIDVPDRENFNPSVEATEIVLTTKDGKRYSMNFITRLYVPYVFDKNRRTGECAKGTYFSRPKMIIVKKMDEKNIKQTIDDYIANHEIENYLTEIV